MKNYIAIFTGSPNSNAHKKWAALDATTQKKREAEGMVGWGSWLEKNQKNIVDIGAPLGKTKQVDQNGITDTKNNMAAYAIVKAESHDAAANLFLEHPHFSIFPGDAVEIMECLAIPGMS